MPTDRIFKSGFLWLKRDRDSENELKSVPEQTSGASLLRAVLELIHSNRTQETVQTESKAVNNKTCLFHIIT